VRIGRWGRPILSVGLFLKEGTQELRTRPPGRGGRRGFTNNAPPYRRAIPDDTSGGPALVRARREVFDLEPLIDVWTPGLSCFFQVKLFSRVMVEMARTAPGCPSAQELSEAVRRICEVVVDGVQVSVLVHFDLSWEPAFVKKDTRLVPLLS